MTRSALLIAVALMADVALAAEPELRDLLPPNSAVTIRLEGPAGLVRHPVIRDAWRELSQSRELRRRLEAPELDKLRQVEQFFAQLAERDAGWLAGLDRITAGGVVIAVGGEPGSPEVFVAALAADEAAPTKFVAAFQQAVLQRLPADRRPAALPTETLRGVESVRVGDARIATIGKVVLAANRADAIERAIDRLKDAASSKTVSPQAASTETERATGKPLLSLDVDLAQIRKLPGVEKGLALPSDDIGRLFVLGGWIDLLRGSDRLSLKVTPGETALDVSVRLSAGRQGSMPGIEGFFASGTTGEGSASGVAAPLLRVPGMIYAGSVFRDYASLWRGREKTLDATALKRFNEADAQAQKQLEVFGAQFAPADFLDDLGTHFRFVVAAQEQSAYQLDLPEKLPAAAFVVDWRKESFRDKLQPILRFFSLIAGADNNQATTTVEKYADADLSVIRFREDAAAAKQGNRIRFQFSPTYTFTRGHFVAGSTVEIVRQVIDGLELERLQKPTPAASGLTESQWLSTAHIAEALHEYRSTLVNRSALENGVTIGDATHELDVARRVLNAIGEMTSRTTFNDDGFEVQLRIGRGRE